MVEPDGAVPDGWHACRTEYIIYGYGYRADGTRSSISFNSSERNAALVYAMQRRIGGLRLECVLVHSVGATRVPQIEGRKNVQTFNKVLLRWGDGKAWWE